MKSIRSIRTLVPRLQVALKSVFLRSYVTDARQFANLSNHKAAGLLVPFRWLGNAQTVNYSPALRISEISGAKFRIPSSTRSLASSASESSRQKSSETRRDVSKVEDPFDAPTYNIPEKPVTFTEGASYSLVILAGLGIAAAAGYKIFGKALERVQNDSQVRVRIGSPITGYGQETRNRSARQRIHHRVWTDEDGTEHVEVKFFIRGPHGAGVVGAEMFKDQVDNQWKYVYLLVDIRSPSPTHLLLESYVPA